VDYARYKVIDVQRTRNILRITLNRPEELNAINQQMHEELSTVFADAAMDRETDVIVLTGAGRAFSAGGDWKWMQHMIDEPGAFTGLLPQSRRIVYSILDCPKPIICRVNGDAVGLGCTLALFCDFVIAVDTCRLADPHVRVGLVAGDGGAAMWTNLVGYAQARRYLLTGDFIAAPEAANIGLIMQAVPAGDLDPTVDKLASRMAAAATQAVSWTKSVINGKLRAELSSVLDTSLAFESLSGATPDHKAAVEAFLRHETPRFPSSART
jgi:enoyl-CoA hydratase